MNVYPMGRAPYDYGGANLSPPASTANEKLTDAPSSNQVGCGDDAGKMATTNAPRPMRRRDPLASTSRTLFRSTCSLRRPWAIAKDMRCSRKKRWTS